ncbi:hypothetical protein [Pelagibius marinus]|uniref:hypothetical protein n=1 Tax=Pelagibius marinus TaxID=2762760 RepID=UPI0018728367|nr:hypothetical protein [Pelagibius marinus]
MRSWMIAVAAVLWLLPSGAQAAAGSGARPSENWTEMQKLEYYIGQIGAALSICGYHTLSHDLTELANLSPYGRKGLASIRVYDSIKGGHCGKLAADGEVLMEDRDQLLAYLQDAYDCPAGQCAPEVGDTSLSAPCRAEADEHLAGLPIDGRDIVSVMMRNGSRQGSQMSTGKKGYEAWVRLNSCQGWVIIELSKGCYPRRAFTRGECEIDGISSY